MGMKDSAKALGGRLKLDSHHAIERFGIIFTALSTLLVLVLVGSGFSAVQNNSAKLDSTPLYVSQFTTSKTGLNGDVTGVYVSSDRTTAMVMMQFDDVASISTDANSYQTFLTGSNTDLGQSRIEGSVTGRVVVFGSTGYMAVLLESSQPFAQQILNLTVRATDELVYATGDTRVRDDLKDDNSFAQHDQWRIYFNPGASKAVTVPALDAPTFDAGSVYASVVTAPEEEEIRANMFDQLGTMRADLARIQSYEDEIGRTSSLDGDFLVPVRGDDPQAAVISIAGDVVVDRTTGKPATAETSTKDMELKTDWVSPNGFQFDWQDGSVYEGYLSSIVPTGTKFGTYLAERAQAKNTTGFDKGKIVWTLTDGTLLADSTDAATVLAPLTDLRTNLETAYQTYYNDKLVYQVDLPTDLLDLEVTLRTVESTYSMNDGEAALLVY